MPEPEHTRDNALEIDQADLQLIVDAAHQAGQIAMSYFGKDPEVWMKEGDSPVSEADHAADQYLQDTLLKARPDYGWLSEESTDNFERLNHQRVFVVDPIDGTRGFIQGHSQWCVSVAVVDLGQPACGVLECPALDEIFSATRGGGARLNGKLLVAGNRNTPLQFAGPKQLIEQFSRQTDTNVESAPFIPSLAYRLAMVASGALDGAYARANSHDWDIAAAQLIITESGAILSELDNEKIIYNRRHIKHGVLVAAGKELREPMMRAAKIETS